VSSGAFTRSCVQALLTLALHLAPTTRVEWLRAMSAEVPYVPERHVLAWAIGCVSAAVKIRILDMLTLKRDISRPVLVLELLLCFGSLVFAGFQYTHILLQFPFLAARLNPGAVILAGTVLGFAGALAMTTGLRQIFGGKAVSTVIAIAIVGSVTLFGAAILAIGGTADITRDLMLLSILPILGTLHLRYLGSHQAVAAS
jgi:hypothetical protein